MGYITGIIFIQIKSATVPYQNNLTRAVIECLLFARSKAQKHAYNVGFKVASIIGWMMLLHLKTKTKIQQVHLRDPPGKVAVK